MIVCLGVFDCLSVLFVGWFKEKPSGNPPLLGVLVEPAGSFGCKDGIRLSDKLAAICESEVDL